MPSPDELRRTNEAARDRISKLPAAILRVSVSLDVRNILQEVAEKRPRRLHRSGHSLSGSFDSHSPDKR